MRHVGTEKSSPPDAEKNKIRKLTPFMRGMREAGSVDIEASSKKTTGKSMTSNDRDPELMQVVHT